MNRLDTNQRAILREYLETRVGLAEEASCSLAQHELAALLDMADKCEELEPLVVTTTNVVLSHSYQVAAICQSLLEDDNPHAWHESVIKNGDREVYILAQRKQKGTDNG